MAVAEGGFGVWAVRLQQASQAVHPEARWLAADVGGPLHAVAHMAASDVWGGPFADQLRGAIRYLGRELAGWADHLSRLHGALEQACWEAENAVRLGAAGVVPQFDVLGALAPWRRWPSPSPPLPADWAAGGSRSVGLVWVYPDRARQLADGLRVTAEQVRGARNRVANALSPVGIDTPVFLEPVAAGLEDVADEIDRRATLLEQVDRELAGAFRDLAAGLGFPGSLAPPESFNPADPIGSSLAGLRAGADVGPGRQPAQVKEADPVSTSTGNYLYEAIDLAQPARGIPTVFARTYNSLRADADGPLGFGWTHSLGTRLLARDGGITVLRGDGHEERYNSQPDGAFVPPPGVCDRLRRAGDGLELSARAGIVHRFAADGRLVALADRSGNTSVLEYADGRAVRLVDASGVATSFEYDDAGRIAVVTGVLDRRWVYGYGQAGDLVSVTDPEGGVTAYGYDDHLLASTDPEGRRVVRNVYDGVGRVVEQRDGAGGRWRYRYEENRTVVTDPLGHTKTLLFDEQYRTTAVTDASGATTRFSWDEASNLVAAEDAAGRTTRFTYNPRGEVTLAEGPGAAPVRFEWDDEGNLTAIASAEGHRAELAWDSASRPIRLVSPGGITTDVAWRADGLPEAVREGDNATTRYTFDGAGRPASITDPLGAVTMVEFDSAGRPVAEAHPGGERMTFAWDRCDRLVAVTDEVGAATRYHHDRCGRLISITDPLGRITRYAYGSIGLLASVTDPLGRGVTFEYDACGRLVGRTDARGLTVSFSYDPADRLVQIEAPGAVPIAYGWDAAGRLVSMTDGTGQSTWELDEAGRPAVEHRPNGIVLAHAYDPLGRRKRVQLRRAESQLGPVLPSVASGAN